MASRPKQAEPRPAPRLYLIAPVAIDAAALQPVLGAADIAAVLLRLADGDERSLINRVKAVAPGVQDKGAALLLDGRPDLVARGGADGAHLTGFDEFTKALEQLKPDRIAGIGELASRHDTMRAAETGADYIMFGGPDMTLEATRDRIAWASELFELPCVAFANRAEEIAPLVAAGADFIALDYVWRDPHGAAAAVADASQYLRLPEPVA
jgi:thiamine-phosphate pyrophosphorylase